jgi:hypothetical protein
MTVDKNQFISLLHHYSGSSEEEAEKLLSLKSEYPYSQLLHTLAARVAKDHGFDNQQEVLQLAAIHAADRTVLKEIITAESQPPFNGVLQPANIPVEMQITAGPKSDLQSYSIKSIDSVDVADELIKDLEKLNALRHNFEMLFVEYSEVSSAPVPAESITPEPKKQEIPKDKTKSKKARIIELAKAMHATGTIEEQESQAPDPKKKKSKKNIHQTDELMEEIQATKREIVPDSEKQKEQIALINQFIKAQPSITNAKDRQPIPVGDLNPIKSGEFGDNIVSETLVEILIKQGKKDKAIEVLKKLIWKYPQKKSYFASQIEDLKK